MTRDEFIAWAKANGWKEDRYGHLQKNQGPLRFKLSRIAVRYEVKSPSGWVRLRSGYYKNLNFTADGKLAGMTH